MARPRDYSLQEKLALMMTSAGSQRKLASFIGASHQQVGRWLSIGHNTSSGSLSRVKTPTDPELLARVGMAFELHRDVCEMQAEADRLPPLDVPVMLRRTTYEDGTPGTRATVDKLHHISDDLRDAIVSAAHRTGFFHAVSARSTVERVPYWFNTERQIDLEHIRRDERMHSMRERLAPAWDEETGELEDPLELQRINTTPIPMGRGVRVGATLDLFNAALANRHAPAVGAPGTALADELLFQTRSNVDKWGKGHAEERRKRRNAESMRQRRAAEARQAQRQAGKRPAASSKPAAKPKPAAKRKPQAKPVKPQPKPPAMRAKRKR